MLCDKGSYKIIHDMWQYWLIWCSSYESLSPRCLVDPLIYISRGIMWAIWNKCRLIHENIMKIVKDECNLLKHVWFEVGAWPGLSSSATPSRDPLYSRWSLTEVSFSCALPMPWDSSSNLLISWECIPYIHDEEAMNTLKETLYHQFIVTKTIKSPLGHLNNQIMFIN